MTRSYLSQRLNPPPRRILVVKLADIGDVLTSTPALRALRETYPGAEIDILVTPNSAAALLGSTLIDRIVHFDKFQFDRPIDAFRPAALTASLRLAWQLRRARYDIVLVLHHLTLRFGRLKYAALALATGASIRVGLDNGHGWFYNRRVTDTGFGAFHEVEYWLQVAGAAGAHSEDQSMAAPYDLAAEKWADARLAQWEGRSDSARFVVIHAGSGGYSLARRWPAERFAQVARTLRDKYDLHIILIGTAGDGVDELIAHLDGPFLNLAGKTSLPQLAAILRRAALFVGADSGVMHIAAAAGAPVVAIFGPSNPDAWGPWTADADASIVVRASEACQPCTYVGFQIGRREGCETRDCMLAVTPDMVLRAAESLLSSMPAREDRHAS